jgi:thiol-disulfide isomerase/thioredoxin
MSDMLAMDEKTKAAPPGSARTGRPVGMLALVGAALGVAAIYGISSVSRNDQSTACPAAAATAARIGPLATGEVAALNVVAAPRPLPPLGFDRPDGSRATLADFKGRTVLLNLWATWCAPCRIEMPALDRLQANMGGPRFEVASVNIDTRNTQRADTFLNDAGVTSLSRYNDHSARIFQDLKSAGLAFGMPTTILVSPEGCVLASLAGPAEWSSADARALLAAAVGP